MKPLRTTPGALALGLALLIAAPPCALGLEPTGGRGEGVEWGDIRATVEIPAGRLPHAPSPTPCKGLMFGLR